MGKHIQGMEVAVRQLYFLFQKNMMAGAEEKEREQNEEETSTTAKPNEFEPKPADGEKDKSLQPSRNTESSVAPGSEEKQREPKLEDSTTQTQKTAPGSEEKDRAQDLEDSTTAQPSHLESKGKGDAKSLEDRLESLSSQLQEAQAQLAKLTNQVEKSGKTYPQVKFLNFRDRLRILVTGGTGFVGSHLVDRLMADGHEVIALDNFYTGSRRNVQQWLGHPNFQLVHHDISNPFFIQVDQVYHLASPASPPHYMANPIKTIKTNMLGTINMLGLARRVHARFLLASTSEVYGDPEVHPQPESYWGRVNPIGPRSCYDEGKRVAEALSVAYEKQEGVDIRIARIFNTFGPRMHMADGRVVSNFILQALQGQPITIYGDGAQTRSFQYVADLVEGLVALMTTPNVTTPVNIGNPEEHSILHFANLVKQLTRSQSPIHHKDAATDDPQQRKPDIAKAKQLLNWQPRVSMQDGLLRTIAYFRQQLDQHARLQLNNNASTTALPSQALTTTQAPTKQEP